MNVTISGWGQFSNEEVASEILQKGTVKILSPAVCLDRLKNGAKVPVRHGVLCTLHRFTRTCRGDSGGPVVIQSQKVRNSAGYLLVGLVSFGASNCELTNVVGYLTEITSFYDWIQENRASSFGEKNHLSCMTIIFHIVFSAKTPITNFRL